jgi:DNA polymerase-3 subunit beta
MSEASFIVDKSTFLRELSIVLSSTESKGTIPILTHVAIDAGEDKITLRGTDLIVAMTTECALAGCQQPGSIALPAKRLHGFLSSLPEGEVKFTVGTNGHATLTCGPTRARIPGMSLDSFPIFPPGEVKVVVLPLLAFGRLISRVEYAISKEQSRFTLDAALLEIESDTNTAKLTATDGHRMAHAKMPCESPRDWKLLIPKRALTELGRLAAQAPLDASVEIFLDGESPESANNVSFRCGSRVLTARKLSGAFPDYKRVLPSGLPYQATVSRELLQKSVERVRDFADERSRCVGFGISSDGVAIKAQTLEGGEGEDMIPVAACSGKTEIRFNAAYVVDYLRAASTENVSLSFRDCNHAAMFEPVDEKSEERYLCVLMPMRI